MEITQIRYFLEVAESQHITKSAEKLHIAQPALSQAIRRMENELGVPLFMPKGRNIVLTEYGEYLKSQLAPIVDRLDEIPLALQKMANANSKTVRLRVLAASTLVTDAVVEYENMHNDVSFQLVQNQESDMFDIEITTKMFYQTDSSREEIQFACPERIFLAVPNNERFKNISSISLEQVAGEQFISLMGSKQFRAICDKFCNRAGIKPNIIFESDSPAAVKNMIGANLGIGFWPEYTWGDIDSDKVKLVVIEEPKCSRYIVATRNITGESGEIAEDFFNFLKEYCKNKSLQKNC